MLSVWCLYTAVLQTAHDVRCTRGEQSATIPSLARLAVLGLIHPEVQLALLASLAHCWLILNQNPQILLCKAVLQTFTPLILRKSTAPPNLVSSPDLLIMHLTPVPKSLVKPLKKTCPEIETCWTPLVTDWLTAWYNLTDYNSSSPAPVIHHIMFLSNCLQESLSSWILREIVLKYLLKKIIHLLASFGQLNG